jgi:dTDP-4-dehydrorhamnose 3,5-epimerase-like enzyme
MAACKLVDLPEVADERGRLMFAEVNRHIPFEVRRIFSIYGVSPGHERASHAHRTNHQFIIMLAGSCAVEIDEGADIWRARLDAPYQGLHVPPLVWITLTNFTTDAVCLVLASEFYDPAEYIRDRGEFRQLLASARQSVRA